MPARLSVEYCMIIHTGLAAVLPKLQVPTLRGVMSQLAKRSPMQLKSFNDSQQLQQANGNFAQIWKEYLSTSSKTQFFSYRKHCIVRVHSWLLCIGFNEDEQRQHSNAESELEMVAPELHSCVEKLPSDKRTHSHHQQQFFSASSCCSLLVFIRADYLWPC